MRRASPRAPGGSVAIIGSLRRSHTHALLGAAATHKGQGRCVAGGGGRRWRRRDGWSRTHGHQDGPASYTSCSRWPGQGSAAKREFKTDAAGSGVNAAMGPPPGGPDLSSIGPGRRRHLRLRKAIMRSVDVKSNHAHFGSGRVENRACGAHRGRYPLQVSIGSCGVGRSINQVG